MLRTHGGAILKRRMHRGAATTDQRPRALTPRRSTAHRHAAAATFPARPCSLSAGTTAAQVLSHVDPLLKARIVTHDVSARRRARHLPGRRPTGRPLPPSSQHPRRPARDRGGQRLPRDALHPRRRRRAERVERRVSPRPASDSPAWREHGPPDARRDVHVLADRASSASSATSPIVTMDRRQDHRRRRRGRRRPGRAHAARDQQLGSERRPCCRSARRPLRRSSRRTGPCAPARRGGGLLGALPIAGGAVSSATVRWDAHSTALAEIAVRSHPEATAELPSQHSCASCSRKRAPSARTRPR